MREYEEEIQGNPEETSSVPLPEDGQEDGGEEAASAAHQEYIPPVPEDFEEEMGGPCLADLHYTITVDEYDRGFRCFQKRYVYPKNWVLTAVFGILFLLYVQQAALDPTYTFAWVLMAVCLIFIGVLWINPIKIRKTLIKSIENIKDDRYTTYLYPDGAVICTEAVQEEGEEPLEIPPRKLSYALDAPEVLEREDMFLIYLKKQMFYVIPKHCLKVEELQEELLRREFTEKLGKRFKGRHEEASQA